MAFPLVDEGTKQSEGVHVVGLKEGLPTMENLRMKKIDVGGKCIFCNDSL